MYLLVEFFLIFVPVLAFCVWQIRLMRKDREARERRKAGRAPDDVSGGGAS